MDARLRLAEAPSPDTGAMAGAIAPTPPESPLDMPMQPVSMARARVDGETDGRWRLGVIIGVSCLVTGLAANEMFAALNVSGMTWLEWVVLVLFTLNFAWISSASATAVAGFLVLMAADKTRTAPVANAAALTSRNAIIFPMYNEQASGVMGGAEATWDALREAGVSHAFEIFFLSDTTDPDVALAEEAVFLDVVKRRPGEPFFYRRRTINRHRKSGNVADFVQRWGGRYDHMVVFDADSLMTPQSLIELVRRMEASPRTALIQTLPVIVNSRTLFARAQQFAMRSYGMLFGAGLAWWSGGAGNFWGHNAIIRTKAFAANAGLPDLPGKAPLGGPILSHDFIEAALLRRAGWRVEIASEIQGSYEESPPTIIDIAARDRRWAQGNLQHLGVVGARGFDAVSRAHITAGVMGYLSAVLWLALILAGLGLSLQGQFLRPDYFPDRYLQPVWPVIDDARAFRLFILTAAIVLSPKWLSLIAWAAGKLPGWSRHPRFILSVATEAVVSALTAPVMMLNQTSAVVSTLLGRDAGWRPQVRDRAGFAWSDLFRHYRMHMIFASTLILAALAISPIFAAWMAPATISLLLAAPLAAWLSKRPTQGGVFWSMLATPEDLSVPPIVASAMRASESLRGVRAPTFGEIMASHEAATKRASLADACWRLPSGQVHAPTANVLARLEYGQPNEKLLDELPPAERMATLNRPDLLVRVRNAVAGPQDA